MFKPALACLPILLASVAPASAESPESPNIIIVNLDDIGAAWFPPYARQLEAVDVEEKICREYAKLREKEGVFDLEKHLEAARNSTPFLDTLAKGGRVFDRCFTSSSLCSPSRSGLLTGRYQQRWGAFFLADVTQATGLPDSVPVLSEYFQKAGYRCGMVGKWHVSLNDESLLDRTRKEMKAQGRSLTPKKLRKEAERAYGYSSSCAPGKSPLDRGFDYYFGYNLDHDHFYESDTLWENRARVPKRPPGEFLTDLLSDKCLEFVSRTLSEQKRFLLYYAPMSMHGTLRPPPERYSSKFRTGIRFSDEWAGHLLAVDEGLRRLYAELKARGQDHNTLLMFTADNGQSTYRVPPYNAPFRGGKGTGWLGGSNVPLIISWPAQVCAGQMHHELVSQLDLFATALDAAGILPSQEIDGRSLLPLIEGRAKSGPHEQIYSSGVQSIGWSNSYFNPGELELKKDKAENEWALCPYYAWVQSADSILMFITTLKPGVYREFPQGRPAQKLWFNLAADPKQERNLYGGTGEAEAASGKLKGWLETTQPPHIKHQEDYRELLEMSGGSGAK